MFLGTVLTAVLFLCSVSHAKSVVVSTSTPTNLLPTSFFGTKTVTLVAGTTDQFFLNGDPISDTQSFVNSSYSISAASGIIVIPNFHGQIWAEAPNAKGPPKIFSMDGQ